MYSKSESKKSPKWFQSQYSGQKNGADSSDGEFAMTVAATAYAIATLEDEQSLRRKNSVQELGGSVSNMKTKEESTIKPTGSTKVLRWFSGKGAKEDAKPIDAGESLTRKTSMTGRRMDDNDDDDDSITEIKKTDNAPSIKKDPSMRKHPSIQKTPTFSDKYLNDGQDKKTGPSASLATKSKTDSRLEGNKIGYSEVDRKAEAYEKAEMAKIQNRYEKMTSTILEWENAKKVKAKRQLDRKESKLEARRARALQEYRDEISRIAKIAGEARAVTIEKKRNAEAKALEKAKELRSTGTVSKTCWGF